MPLNKWFSFQRWIGMTLLLLMTSGCESDHDVLPGVGNWRVINYWAIWCTPCREEIPELNRLDQLTDITVLGVNFDGKEGAELEQHIAEMAIAFAVLDTDPSGSVSAQRPQVLPTTLLIDPQGQLQKTLVGPQTEEAIVAILTGLGR